MTRTAVDSNVLFDILLDDPVFAESSQSALLEALQSGQVVVCPVVYAELAAHFSDTDALDLFLRESTILVEPFQRTALLGAGSAWKRYVRRRGQGVQCPRCGHRFGPTCPACDSTVVWRQHLIADFLVGSHADAQADALLSRDRGYYHTYFPQLKLLSPG